MESARRSYPEERRSAESQQWWLDYYREHDARVQALLAIERDRLRGSVLVTVDRDGRSFEDIHGA